MEESKKPLTFIVTQRMMDDHKANCPKCGAPAKRMLGSPGIQFVGSGFHVNDYPRR